MKIYDISQELLSCAVYPGDPAPRADRICSIDRGDVCNLTALSLCAHNGTHLDAPYHFIRDGRTVEAIPLSSTVGLAFVFECEGEISGEDAAEIVETARRASPEAARRILIKGRATVTLAAAERLAAEGVLLVGVESQTVGPEDAPMAVHKVLLGADAVLLEGVRLGEVPSGVYLLSAPPISVAGGDGAPCRAILIEL